MYITQALSISPAELIPRITSLPSIDRNEYHIHHERFDFAPDKPKVFRSRFIPHRFHAIFHELEEIYHANKTLANYHTSLYLQEKNDRCQLILAHYSKSNTQPYDKVAVPISHEEWANTEELLLISGFTLIQQVEHIENRFTLPHHQGEYRILEYPDIPPYLEIRTHTKKEMVQRIQDIKLHKVTFQPFSFTQICKIYHVNPHLLLFP